ncbi:hypothetical protein PENTCL1PPCAC_17425, partial [Pristionchus entomophagus]
QMGQLSEESESLRSPPSPLWSLLSYRLRIALLLALALTIEGLMRSNLNMAYVCMVEEMDSTRPTSSLLRPSEEDCPLLTLTPVNVTERRMHSKDLLKWRSSDRAYLFPIFYVGGLVVTFATEYLDRKLGASRTVLIGACLNVVGTMASPSIAAHLGPIALTVVRFIMGAGQGVLWPGMSVLVARWFPVVEKSTALAIATTGNQLSVIFSMIVTAELCQIESLGGWPAAFYIYGVLGILLCVLWWAVVVDSPEDCTSLSVQERDLLIGPGTMRRNGKKPKPNWSVILSSPVVWSISLSAFCHNFVVVAFSSYLPFYYKTVHNMSLTSNGLLSTLPFVVQFASKVVFAGFADSAKQKKTFTVTTITKICNSSASFGIALSLVVISFCDCSSRWAAVVAASTAMAFISGYVPGYNTSVVCVAPSQTAAISSFSRLWAQIGMSLSPALIGLVVTTGRVEEWRGIFFGMAALCVVTGVFFQISGSAALQPHLNDLNPTATKEKLLVDSSASSEKDQSKNEVTPP